MSQQNGPEKNKLTLRDGWLISVWLGPRAAALVTAAVHPDVVVSLLDERKYSSLGEYAGIIVKDRALESPTAIFKGLNRPLHSEGVDNFVFAYCCKPACTYRYTDMYRPADALVPPKNSIFATYLTLNRAMLDRIRGRLCSPSPAFRGIVLGWEWIPESPTQPGLPIDHATRYKRRLKWN